jgi:hypothetical protein
MGGIYGSFAPLSGFYGSANAILGYCGSRDEMPLTTETLHQAYRVRFCFGSITLRRIRCATVRHGCNESQLGQGKPHTLHSL